MTVRQKIYFHVCSASVQYFTHVVCMTKGSMHEYTSCPIDSHVFVQADEKVSGQLTISLYQLQELRTCSRVINFVRESRCSTKRYVCVCEGGGANDIFTHTSLKFATDGHQLEVLSLLRANSKGICTPTPKVASAAWPAAWQGLLHW